MLRGVNIDLETMVKQETERLALPAPPTPHIQPSVVIPVRALCLDGSRKTNHIIARAATAQQIAKKLSKMTGGRLWTTEEVEQLSYRTGVYDGHWSIHSMLAGAQVWDVDAQDVILDQVRKDWYSTPSRDSQS
jgi:hypothetical protein